MLITYPRTAAEYQSLAAGLNASVMQLIKDGRLKVSYKILFRHLVKKRASENPAYLDELNRKAMGWFAANGRNNQPSQAIAYHHSGAVVLHGFTVEKFHYVKKADREVYKNERTKEFNKIRPLYCKHLAESHRAELISAGLSNPEIDRMAETGRPPDGYQVHHRYPLDDGGTNDFGNLILMRDDIEHRAVHGRFNPNELAVDTLTPGKGATVAHLLPPADAKVYPNAASGYVSEKVSNHYFLEMLNDA